MKNFLAYLGVLCFCSLPYSLAYSQPTRPQILVLEIGLLIDGSGGAPLENAAIVIEGERVKAVGPIASVAIPQSARVIKANRLTAFPGLIDSHVHYKEWQAELYLNHGVTTALAIGSEPIEWIVAQKEGIAKGKIIGPRIFASGPHLNSPIAGERPTRNVRELIARRRFEVSLKSPEEARKAVRELRTQGADIVKIYEDTTPEVIKAATEEAKKLGMAAGGHSIDISMSVENGYNFVEHSHAIVASSIKDAKKKTELHQRRTARRDAMPTSEFHYYAEAENFDELVRFMVERKVHWGPTIATTWRALTPKRGYYREQEFNFLKNPNLNYLPPYFTANLRTHFDSMEKISDQEFLKRLEIGYDKLGDFIRRFVKAGGKLHTGSDPNAILPAWAIHTEMEMLVDIGLSPMQALLAATRNPAEMIGKENELGVIKTGSIADIVLVEGNPLADITKTRGIKMVFKEGKPVKLGYTRNFRNPIPRPEADRPAPEIDDIAPRVVLQGEGSVSLKVMGENFLSTAVVTLNGKPLPTQVELKADRFAENFERVREITATIDPKLTQNVGTYEIRVLHEGLGGAVSNPAPFIVKFK